MTPRLAGLAALLAGCGSERPAPAPPPPAGSGATTAEAPTDSLVLTTADGYQVWLTEARPARDSTGRPCLERSVEIRTDSSRVKVPLLYVVAPPTLLRRGQLRAELARDCRTTDVYRVDLATGRPTRIPSG